MSAKKLLAWTFLNENATFLIQFVFSIVMARLLIPAQFGYMAIIQPYVEFCTQIRQFGLSRYIIQTADLNRDRLRSSVGVMLVASWTLGTVLMLLGWLIAYLYDYPELKVMMRIVAFGFYIVPFSQPNMMLYERAMRFSVTTRIGLSCVVANGAVSIGCAFSGLGATSIAWGNLASQFTMLILIVIFPPPQSVFKPSLKYWRECVSYGAFPAATGLITTLAAYAPGAILGKIINAATAGIYSRAYGLVNIVRVVILVAINRYLSPAMSQLKRNNQSVTWTYKKAISLSTALAWSGCAVLGVLATPIIHLLYGERWVSAGPILSLLCISQGIVVGLVGQDDMMFLAGRDKKTFTIELTLACISVANFSLWSHFSVLHAAAGRSIDSVLFLVTYAICLRPILHYTWEDLGHIYSRSMALAAITAMPAIAVLAHYHWANALPFGVLLALVPMSGMAWLVGLKLTRHPIYEDVASIFAAVANHMRARFGS